MTRGSRHWSGGLGGVVIAVGLGGGHHLGQLLLELAVGIGPVLDVGTTTIRLGVTRHGPLAPEACQFGKYDAFTSTGDPTWSTWKEMRSSPVRIDVTLTLATGVRGGFGSAPPTRCHCFGPDAA